MKDETIQILGLLSHPMRVRVMALMARKPRTVDQVTEELPIERASVNFHITNLRKLGVLNSTEGSRPVFYELDKRRVAAALTDFARAAKLEVRLGEGEKAKIKRKIPTFKRKKRRRKSS